jgi:uncharacterized protein YjdB
MSRQKKVFALVVGILVAANALFVTCKQPGGSGSTAVAGVRLSKTALALEEGESAALLATILPSGASNKGVTWEVEPNDGSVVTISGNGLNCVVDAKGIGDAVITVTTNDGKKTATCTVKVVAVKVTGITLNTKALELEVGAYTTLLGMVLPVNAEDRRIEWESDKPAIADVDPATGVVTAKATGLATITATTVDGGFKDTCDVTVRTPRSGDEIAVTGIMLNRNTMTLDAPGIGTLTGELRATITPSDADNQAVRWYSSDTSVATVGSGDGLTMTVTAKAAGSAVIIATTNDGGKTAMCSVTVQGEPEEPEPGVTPVDGIALRPNMMILDSLEAEEELVVTITPSNATHYKNITWTSSSPVVTVVKKDEFTATVTAKRFGTAVIMAVTENGKIAICNIEVKLPPDDAVRVDGLTLEPPSATLKIGENETVELTATVSPEDATNKNVTWTSSNDSVATVESTGLGTALVTAVSRIPAVAIITATSVDGRFYEHCNITVTTEDAIPVTGITLYPTSLTFTVTDNNFIDLEEQTLTATIAPPDASIKDINWTLGPGQESIISLTPSADGKTAVVKALQIGTATVTAITVDGGKPANCSVTVKGETISVTGIELLDTNPVELTRGEDGFTPPILLRVKVLPEDATDQGVTWDQGYPVGRVMVAQTVPYGPEATVVGTGRGTTVVTATTRDGGYSVSYTVTISGDEVHVEYVQLNTSSLVLRAGGGAALLQAYVQPPNADDKSVTWISSNDNVATVSENGLVTAVNAGPANITVTTKDGGKQAVCSVEVQTTSNTDVLADGVTVAPTFITMKPDDTATLIATVSPSNATDQRTNWLSTNPDVVEVDQGRVTAKKYGEAFIIVTTVNSGNVALCFVNVPPPVVVAVPVTAITLEGPNVVPVGQSITLTATVEPEDATNKTVNWTSSNPTRAMVFNGIVTGFNPGEVTIVATAVGGNGIIDTRTITVEPALVPVTDVRLNLSTYSMRVGDSPITLIAEIVPSDATNKNVTWSVVPSGVVSITSDGLSATVTPLAFGNATVMITTQDGPKTATCFIKVDYKVNSADSGISFAQIADEDWGLENITLAVREGVVDNDDNPVPTTKTITIKDKAQYTSIICYVNKATVAGTVSGDDMVFVLDAAKTPDDGGVGKETGSYYLTLEVRKGSKVYGTTVDLVLVDSEEEEE